MPDRDERFAHLPEPVHDPETRVDVVQMGSPLRDAAVDPAAGDYLPPRNAGRPGPDGNPHGTNVVAPGLEPPTGFYADDPNVDDDGFHRGADEAGS